MVKRPQKPSIQPPVPGDYGDPTIPMSQERWIGRIVAEWAKLEATLDDLIWQFLNLPIEYGRIITARMDATAKIAMLRALSNLALDPLLQDYLKEYIDTVDILREDRNFIVHGTWGRTIRDRTPIALSLRPKDTPSTVVSETFPPERMKAIWIDIVATKWKLIALFESARASHHKARAQFQEPSPIPLPNPLGQTN